MKSFVYVSIVFYLSTSVAAALNWEDGEFGGQVKWSFNCDFYDEDGPAGSRRYEDNELADNDNDLIRIIGEHKSNREDCGWLCWADVECHYYSHSQNVCRTMSLTKKVLVQPAVAHGRAFIHHVTVPYLADSETICGYIPSRIVAFNTSVY
ncbi:hypothetical protein GHT06_011071 [Daphnia sinensis]|uniref:Uncharacterized protein n=1 Tax=Daphnia sinensis TaxID=1820382 RepID=A0AAD5L010_9CRUS|nr:hypothetical protein GHT06_011071 [Daphnia sinensis]